MSRRTAAAAVVVLAIALLGHGMTYSAFSRSVTGSGNRFVTGTVLLADNDNGGAMLTLTDAQAGASDTGCIQVVYGGSLPSALRLRATVSGDLAPYLNVVVTRGYDTAPAFDACVGFVADWTDHTGLGNGVVYSGTLAAYPGTWEAGVVDPPAGTVETWTTGEARSYRIAITLSSDAAALGKSAAAAFTWEARNL